MAKVKVFLSFEFDKDDELHHNFFAQATRGNTCHEIDDYSMNEVYRPDNNEWLEKARRLISSLDIVIVVIGEDTHNAPGVEKEVTIANQLGKPIFQICPQSRTSGEVPGAGEVIPWKWQKIDAAISERLKI